MKKLVFFLVVLAGALAHAQNIVGDWQGALKIGPSELRLVLHITKGDNGGFKATLDSIDQGANGIPVSSVSLKDSQLDLNVEMEPNYGSSFTSSTLRTASPRPSTVPIKARMA